MAPIPSRLSPRRWLCPSFGTIRQRLLYTLIGFIVLACWLRLGSQLDVESISSFEKQYYSGQNMNPYSFSKPATKSTSNNINLTLLTSTSTDGWNVSVKFTDASFFDCRHTHSKCQYFYPGIFFRNYFVTTQKGNNITDSMNIDKDNENNNGSNEKTNLQSFNEQHYIKWRKEIGLQNLNLPSLTSLSWWWNDDGFTKNVYEPTLFAEAIQLSNSSGSSPEEILNVTLNNQQLQQNLHQQIQAQIDIPQNLTYIHVHKCGGTSIQSALWVRARKIRNIQFRMHKEQLQQQQKQKLEGQEQEQDIIAMQSDVHTYKHSFGGGTPQKKKQWDKERWDHIQAIVSNGQYHQRDFDSSRSSQPSSFGQFPMFTIVRDPINRFLSAIQQVMHYNTDFRNKCLHDSLSKWWQSSKKRSILEALARKKTIQCAIEDMRESKFQGDVHLLPMAAHFRLLDDVVLTSEDDKKDHGIGDVAVSVFSMEDMNEVLLHLSGSDGGSNTISSSINKEKSTIHARDRSDEAYATSPILSMLSANDCTEEMIQHMCDLYHVDVKLMKWLGFGGQAVDRCRVS